jgi:23S rRNA (uracil1939-C5)-methyltransferase
MAEIVTIDSIGHHGDGIALGPAGPVYVPFTLPGERVAIERHGERGRLLDILEPSAERVEPPCPHFGACGGCALQMLPLEATRRLKRSFVAAALSRQGVEAEVGETVGIGLGSRRRAVLTALRVGDRIVLGYNERLSNRVIDIEECPVLVAPLTRRLSDLRALLAHIVIGRKPARVTALLTRGGLDVDVDGAPMPSPRTIPTVASLALGRSIARLSVNGEPILSLVEPVVEVSGALVVPPPGAFLQASAEAERIMAELVTEHLAGCRRVVDLFSGIGTFTLALARSSAVRAFESSQPALDALATAVRRAKGLKRVETERRDLFAFPLSPDELNTFDGAVIDPPRAGAKAQAAAFAASTVPRIASVSCNPASFARDARILIDGGYTLERVVPVDQFVFSAETEVVGLFRRAT